MSLADIAPMIMADNRDRVYSATWGHLAPKKNTTYKGYLLVAKSCFGEYGGTVPVDMIIEGLDSSPWFYESMNEMLDKLELEEGCFYKVFVTFRNYKWWTKIVKINH